MVFTGFTGYFIQSMRIMRIKINIPVILICLIIVVSGCKSINRDPYSDTPTTGKIRIYSDETFRKIIEAELGVFQAIYNYSEVKPYYVPENELFRQILSDSARLIIASRYLNKDENRLLNDKKLFPRQTKIAVDGIAMIVNPSNSINRINLIQLKKIFTGEIKYWDELSEDKKSNKITIVFDNQQSSILRMITDSICREKPLTKDAYALQFNQDVISYVARTPSALGLIGVSWISDPDDTLQLSFLKQIKVVSISRNSDPNPGNSFKPFQAYLREGLYPLTREIIMINTEPRNGLATGLSSFMASDKGQRILLKSGVLPAIAPTRVVNVRENI